jgi:acetyl-CoA acetyltransferase
MTEAYLVDGVRTPIGRFAGALASVRPDDLAAHVLRELLARHPQVGSPLRLIMEGDPSPPVWARCRGKWAPVQVHLPGSRHPITRLP